LAFIDSYPKKINNPGTCIVKNIYDIAHGANGVVVMIGDNILIRHDGFLHRQSDLLKKSINEANKLKELGVCTDVKFDPTEEK
jgi:hypothetical protein